MSYCRFSTDDFNCDLYCYADIGGGYTTHVANNRHVGEIPKTPPWPSQRLEDGSPELKAWAEAMSAAMKVQSDWLATCERKEIGLPYDGRTFNDPTLAAFLGRLRHLKQVGYRFPSWVIDDVEKELAAEEVS